jgi:hypothetical protein
MTYDTLIRVCSRGLSPDQLMAAAMAAGGGGRAKRRDYGDGLLALDAPTAAARVSVHYTSGGGFYPSEPGTWPTAYMVVSLQSSSGRGVHRPARHQEMLREIGAWLDKQGARWYWCDPQEGGPWARGGRRG